MKPKPTIFDYYQDESDGATELQRLLRSLESHYVSSKFRSILITSALKSEGKSLIAANLSIATAKKQSDQKVILIDCDLRRPQVHSLFGINREPGLASLINKEVELNDAIQDTELDNLKIISCGSSVPQPAQILAGAGNVLGRCKELFDIVICDAPPVVPVDDVGLLCSRVDGVIMVIMAGKTDRMIVGRAMEILGDARANVLGVALNNLHRSLPYYHEYKYYHYEDEKKKS